MGEKRGTMGKKERKAKNVRERILPEIGSQTRKWEKRGRE
jgi:hypothetical protein